jgi:glycosyltransferase involved in cell wall biosynthesis
MLLEDTVAIVHDSCAQNTEATRVLEEIASMLPNAHIFSTSALEDGYSAYVQSRSTKATWMTHLPAKWMLNRRYVLLNPLAFKALDLSSYEVVISNCAGSAKSVSQRDGAVHICYCHSPLRLSGQSSQYHNANEGNGRTPLLLRPLHSGLRLLDVQSSVQPDYYIAKSHAVANHIKLRYGRNAVIVHPPIDTSQFYGGRSTDDYLLIVSELSAHKRIDMAIVACNSMRKRLVIVGDGADRARLEALSGPTIHFVGHRTDSEVADLLSRCQAIFCPDMGEEFDTMPLKGNASGRPAISFAGASTFETIVDGETGVLCEECSRPAIVDAIERCVQRSWDPNLLRTYARRFDAAAFRSKFSSVLGDICGGHLSTTAVA